MPERFYGHRAYSHRPQKRGKNQPIIGALTRDGIIAALTLEGGTDGLAFQTFVQPVLAPKLWPGACVVMDNFSAPKVDGIAPAIEAVGAKVVYLPSYSPDFGIVN